MTLLRDMVRRWRKFGSQRKTMFVLDADERLSNEMEKRAVLEGPESPQASGRSRAAMRRCAPFVRFQRRLSCCEATPARFASLTHCVFANSEAMRALRAARWAINFKRQEGHDDDDGEDVPLSFSQRREALGSPPVRRTVTGPEGVRLGPAQKLMLEREQEIADCEYELATLDHQHSMNEIAGEEQEEEVAIRQAAIDKCNVKLQKISEKEEQLAERWRVNKEDVKLRKSLGAGRTMKLLEAEMDELDEEGDRLVQERRMAEAEKNQKVRDRADAAEVHEAILETGALSSFCLLSISGTSLCCTVELRVAWVRQAASWHGNDRPRKTG